MISRGERERVQRCFGAYLATEQKNDQIPWQRGLFPSSDPDATFPKAAYGTHGRSIAPGEQRRQSLSLAIFLIKRSID
jgi:hypothetical protein